MGPESHARSRWASAPGAPAPLQGREHLVLNGVQSFGLSAWCSTTAAVPGSGAHGGALYWRFGGPLQLARSSCVSVLISVICSLRCPSVPASPGSSFLPNFSGSCVPFFQMQRVGGAPSRAAKATVRGPRCAGGGSRHTPHRQPLSCKALVSSVLKRLKADPRPGLRNRDGKWRCGAVAPSLGVSSTSAMETLQGGGCTHVIRY